MNMTTDLITTYSDPFRLRVIEALDACLEEITIANGYAVDLTDSVLWGRTRYDEDDPLPMVSLLEPPVPSEWEQSLGPKVQAKGSWPLLVQGFVPDDRDRPTAPAYVLAAQVKRRLAVEKFNNKRPGSPGIFGMGPQSNANGNSVVDIIIGSEVIRPADEQSSKAFFWLPVTLLISENHLQPYA